MIKKFTAGIFFLISVVCQSQNYGNEWIDHNLQYRKFPVYREGIYRIDSTTLAQHYNLGSVNPQQFQLFLKGKEVRLYVEGEADGKIGGNDYLEFYANPLMGEVDSLIYSKIAYLPNPYGPLFNDTIFAFLTVNPAGSPLRYTLETDTAITAWPQADHFYHRKFFSQPFTYNPVTSHNKVMSDPHYTQAEGRGYRFEKGQNASTVLPGLVTFTNNPALSFYLTTTYAGMSEDIPYTSSPDHQVVITYSNAAGNVVQLSDTTFHGYASIRQQFTLDVQNIHPNTNFRFDAVAVPSFTNSSTMLHYVELFYPHRINLGNQNFMNLAIDNSTSSTKSSFHFFNFTSGPPAISFLDITNGRKIPVVSNGQFTDLVFPHGPTRAQCYMASGTAIIPVTNLYPVNLTGSFVNYLNNPAGKNYLLIYNRKLESSAQAYSNYRKSQPGGTYNVVMADVSELYEQFCYGINRHPLAIRNFIRFMNDKLSGGVSYVLLLGKSYNHYDILTHQYKNQDLVPSMGEPACDNLLTAAIADTNSNGYYPDIPIGRLACTSDAQVMAYLNKVQQHESSGMVEWKKRVLHFVGGDSEWLSAKLSAYMSNYETVIRDSLYGAEVFTFRKNTTQPVQTSVSDSIRNTINYGAALLTFFGHGSEAGFDQAIDDPSLYNNAGRYPFVLANSCLSGDIHLKGPPTVSENFVLIDQKGSIGFLATTDEGYDHSLNEYSQGFYEALSYYRYNQGVGHAVKEAARRTSGNGDFGTMITGMDMTLHGDPAVVISNGPLPDYSIRNNDVSFKVDPATDSLNVIVAVKNTGKAIKDSLFVRVERFFPNGDSSVAIKAMHPVMYKDTCRFSMQVEPSRGIGLNQFRVKVDNYDQITEVSESNNSTSGLVDLFIQGGDIMPAYPYRFAIVPKTNKIILKASTTDPFSPAFNYRLQLDTNDTFENPIASTLINSKGGVIEWEVDLPFKDSTVYFWRVSRDSISPLLSYSWKESSFQTIGDKRGWGQSHFHQFKNDGFKYVTYVKKLRKFVFQNNKHSILARNGVFPHLALPNFSYYFNNYKMDDWSCTFNGWNFAVFDSISGFPQEIGVPNPPVTGPFNNCVCRVRQYVYSFGSIGDCPSTWQANIENFLTAIPVNNYVLAYTTGYHHTGSQFSQVSSFSNSLYQQFESIGAGTIRNIKDTVPYILFGRKGMSAGQGHESVGQHSAEVIVLEDSIHTRWNSGFVASEEIGPARQWGSLHWRLKGLESNPGDSVILKLAGRRSDGTIDTLAIFPADSADILALGAYVNADVHPYLKLVAYMKDQVHRTSPQLERWQVLYDEAPECAINPLKGFTSMNDTLMEGDKVILRMPIENIGHLNFEDSLVVTYWVENSNRVKQPLPQKMKSRPFVPGQVFVDTLLVNSYQLRGNNAIWMHVNPLQNERYQHEQYQFNNIARYPFTVNKDVTNPLLDVTFDGVRILNGDLVSSKPDILITLKDENRFLALNDTSAFTIYLQRPGQNPQRIYFNQGLEFRPAELPKNSASINFRPTLGQDGRYLLTVQARDRSANISGSNDYKIEFEVDTKPGITAVMNYPNPFTSSTRFVFTLTGSEIPEVFTIQIMTVSGKVVREITRAELGDLHIGRNITQYAWDGRDTYGDKLGNGVYLYRVITRLNGSTLEKRDSAADKFINKEFGKMVLMR